MIDEIISGMIDDKSDIRLCNLNDTSFHQRQQLTDAHDRWACSEKVRRR